MNNVRTSSRIITAITALAIAFIPFVTNGQEESASTPPKENKPVRTPFQCGTLIDAQTYVVMPKNRFEFMIQHRFGKLNNEGFDLFGLYAPSNIRLGLNYGITDKLQVGIGTTKNNMLQDLNWKYGILTQTRSNSMPIALTYYGNLQYDARDKESFGTEYKSSHRMSYFHQLILGRKFSPKITLQASFGYAHYNQLDSVAYPDLEHANMGFGLAGRIGFSPQGSFFFEYDHPLTTPEIIKPNLSLGVEIATSSHSFQIFITTYDGISPQKNMMFNTNDFTQGDFLLGFNITRNWNF